MMNKIKVDTSTVSNKAYYITIGIKLSKIAEEILKKFPDRRFFIITDDNVKKLYGQKFLNYFKDNGVECRLISIKPGEKSKKREVKELLEDKLIHYGADRTSMIIALGGGVVGDIAGFTAATLFRGVPYIQIPTTLLAQVDSSVGGKVAVDHPAGKNLIGAFYPPEAVYIDIGVLATLPESEYLNGLAEVIKYAAIMDKDLFEMLDKKSNLLIKPKNSILKKIITRCCELKREVVIKDEREKSYRRILNFGHTIGHSIELLSNYKIAHGFAIAKGMAIEADFSVRIGLMQKDEAEKLKHLLYKFGFDLNLPIQYSMDDYLNAMKTDKKNYNGKFNFTLLKKIGKAEINVFLNQYDLKSLLMFYDLR